MPFFEKEEEPILLETAKPGRKPPEGAMPRFRSEIGPFLGLAAGLAGGGASSGFESTDSPSRGAGTMDIAARVGVGLEALLGDAGDGQIFLQAGVLQELGTKDACVDPCSGGGVVANIALRTPARVAIATRIRMPFWLIPGDLIVAAPILGFLAPKTYANMAMVAASGGVIPWQTGLSTFLGRVQFILGREVGVSFFGYSGGEDQLFVATPGIGQRLADGDLAPVDPLGLPDRGGASLPELRDDAGGRRPDPDRDGFRQADEDHGRGSERRAGAEPEDVRVRVPSSRVRLETVLLSEEQGN